MCCPTACSGPSPRTTKTMKTWTPRRTSPSHHTTPDTDDRPQRHLFERARAVIPGGRQLARTRLQGRGRHAPLHPARAGRLLLGRQRQALHRLHRLLGSDDPGPRPPCRGRGGAEGRDSKASRTARRPSARSNWPRPSSRWCRRWRWCDS